MPTVLRKDGKLRMENLGCLLDEVEKISRGVSDRHYSIFKFSTHFKGAFGTPNRLRLELPHLPAFDTLEKLLIWMVSERVSFSDIETENIEGFKIHNGIYHAEGDFIGD
jgi:hypothetical protein